MRPVNIPKTPHNGHFISPGISKAPGKHLPNPSHQVLKGEGAQLLLRVQSDFQSDVASPSSKKVTLKVVAAEYVSKATLSSAVRPRCWAVLILWGSALCSLWNPGIAVSCILGLLLFDLLFLGFPFKINEKPKGQSQQE